MLENRRPQGYSQFSIYIMAFTGLAYIVMGGFIIYNQWLLVPITQVQSYAMGALSIAYGLYRTWRAYNAYKDSSQN